MPLKRDFPTTAVARVRGRLPEVYLAVALVVGMMLCFLTPPFWTPDEDAHARREVEIAHGGWTGKRVGQQVGDRIDANLDELVRKFWALHVEALRLDPIERAAGVRPGTHAKTSEDRIAPLRVIRWSHELVFSAFPNTAIYPPWLYLPQVAGWRLGQALDLTIVHSMELARMNAALCAILMGWMALRLCGSERWMMFGYLLIPTLLNLNASCSQDAVLLNAAALAAALVGRAVAMKRLLTTPELIAATILLALCAQARPPYLSLALILFLPALEAPGGLRHWRQAGFGVLFIGLGVLLWQYKVRELGVWHVEGSDPTRQIAFLMAHPFRGCVIVVGSTLRALPALTLKGTELLGISDVGPPHIVSGLLLLGLAGMVGFSPWHGLRTGYGRMTVLLAAGATVLGISFIEYVIWSSVGGRDVDGLQSRYYLPLLPVVFLLFREGLRSRFSLRGWMSDRVRDMGLLISTAVFVSMVLVTPWAVAQRFYHIGLGEALRYAFP